MIKNSSLSKDIKLWNFLQSEEEESVFRDSIYRLDYIIKNITKNKHDGNILDIGLGNGYLVNKLFYLGRYQVYGLDVSDVNINKLKRRLSKGIRLFLGNINNLPFDESVYDVVVCSEVIEHLNDVDLLKAIEEAHRVLKKDGLFIVTVPADEVLAANVWHCPNCGESFHRYGHKQSFSKERLKNLFGSSSFANHKIRKILEINKKDSIKKKIKHYVKNKLVNLPFRYFDSFVGRYMVIAYKNFRNKM